MNTAEVLAIKAEKIVKSISGKNVTDRRRAALQAAGFEVSEVRNEWNFGAVGTSRINKDGSIDIQVRYATGGKSRSGYGVNACPVVTINFKP